MFLHLRGLRRSMQLNLNSNLINGNNLRVLHKCISTSTSLLTPRQKLNPTTTDAVNTPTNANGYEPSRLKSSINASHRNPAHEYEPSRSMDDFEKAEKSTYRNKPAGKALNKKNKKSSTSMSKSPSRLNAIENVLDRSIIDESEDISFNEKPIQPRNLAKRQQKLDADAADIRADRRVFNQQKWVEDKPNKRIKHKGKDEDNAMPAQLKDNRFNKDLKGQREFIFGRWVVRAALLEALSFKKESFPNEPGFSAKKREVYKLYVRRNIMEQDDNEDDQHSLKDIQEVIQLANLLGIPVVEKPRHELDKLSLNRPHSGLILETSFYSLHRVLSLTQPVPSEKQYVYEIVLRNGPRIKKVSSSMASKPLWIALDQVVDPQNLGAILRSAYFFGAEGIILCSRDSAPLSNVTSKASSGAMEVLPLYSTHNLHTFLKDSQNSEWDVIGTYAAAINSSSNPKEDNSSLSTHVNSSELRLKNPSILVLGNEGVGLRNATLKHCNIKVTIPFVGNLSLKDVGVGEGDKTIVDSLNVSVAAGVLLHQLSNMH